MTCCYPDHYPDFYKETWRTANTSHRCCECEATIQPRETYQYISGKWDGSVLTFKTCEKCADLRESLQESWCVSLGDLKQEYLEFCRESGISKYSEELHDYVYPANHLTKKSADNIGT